MNLYGTPIPHKQCFLKFDKYKFWIIHFCGTTNLDDLKSTLLSFSSYDLIITVMGCLWNPCEDTLQKMNWVKTHCNAEHQPRAIFLPCNESQLKWFILKKIPTISSSPYLFIDIRRFVYNQSNSVYDALLIARGESVKQRHLILKVKNYIVLGDGNDGVNFKEGSLLNTNSEGKSLGIIDPKPLINSAKILLCTSKYEGWPRTVGEALACGKPIVSVKAGNVDGRLKVLNDSNCVWAESSAEGIASSVELAIDKLNDGSFDPRKISSDFCENVLVWRKSLCDWIHEQIKFNECVLDFFMSGKFCDYVGKNTAVISK